MSSNGGRTVEPCFLRPYAMDRGADELWTGAQRRRMSTW